MADRLEDRIRNYLAAHLTLLEPGLLLVSKEHSLPYAIGAGGKIDILARDKLGIFVIIEIKRSDQSARQALNEIHKYTGLLRMQHGLDERHVRIVIVSTEWRELRLPLSECVDTFPYSIEPVAIEALQDGTISSLQRVELLKKVGSLKINREQHGFCFKEKAPRDEALPKLISAASRAGIKDFAIFALEFQGTDPSVCFPFGLYFVFSSPLLDASPEEAAQIKSAIQWDDNLDYSDSNFVCALLREHERFEDDSEVGSPEKLCSTLENWNIVQFSRHGRLASERSLLTDDDIVRLAIALEGGSDIYFSKMSSPKYIANWQALRKGIGLPLRGMPEWEAILPTLLDELEQTAREATVSFDLHNPANLLMCLYPIASLGDFRHCPFLEVVVENVTAGSLKIVVSMLAWNGKVLTENPEHFVERIYGHTVNLLSAIHFHQTFAYEPALLAVHGLFAPVVEFSYTDGHAPTCAQLELEGRTLVRKPFDLDSIKGMPEFAQANADYFRKLKKIFDSCAIGLPGQSLDDMERQVEEVKAKRSTHLL